MYGYVMRRLLLLIPTVIIISLIAFIVMELPPGDFLSSYIVQLQAEGATVSSEHVEALRRRYGLDQPSYVRYFRWMNRIIFHGDFGRSWNYNRPVSHLLAERLPFTLLITTTTLIFQYIISIPIGIYTAVKQHGIADYIFTFAGFLGLSIPNFMLALVLMFLTYTYFGTSMGGLFSETYRNAPWSIYKIIDLLSHLWVPVVVVGTAGTASLIRILRGVMLDELGKDYMQTARAKGLPERVVIIKHAVRIAINPIISTIVWMLPRIISGGAITAIVLNLPTIGPLLLTSLLSQDMFVAGSVVLILSILTVLGSFISDLLLAWSDPRIKYE
ncbi:MAG: ABC transporter permease [Halanaerobiales bacterium]